MDAEPGSRRVVVLGGGLAGIAAACRLADRGHRVTLLERRPFLGGRAFSFYDPETGWDVDNGQHVFVGCCTAYIGLLKRLGVLDRTSLQDRFSVPIIAGGKTGKLTSYPLPPPLHLLPSFVAYPHLGWRDKALLLYGLFRIATTDRFKRRRELEGETFLDWLRCHGQTERAIRNFWGLVTLPILNSGVEAVSAFMGLMVFQEGLLKGRHDADMGYARAGLTTLVQDAALTYLAARGGEVRFQTPAGALRVENGAVQGVETPAGFFQADAYVSALPFDALLSLLPQAVREESHFRRAEELRYAPIVGVHIWLDRPVTDPEVAAYLDSPVQWLFNKTAIHRRDDSSGQYLCISLSGAWEYIDLPREELELYFVGELRHLFPGAREAQVRRVLVVKQPQATFIPEPGSEAHRLPAVTPLANLFLAGDWTQTGWPATMEGAVRSGNNAAGAVSAYFQGWPSVGGVRGSYVHGE